MDFVGERYYNIYRILLTAIGLWPYKKPMIFHSMLISCTFISSIFFQCMPFFTKAYNFEFIIRQLSYILPVIAYYLLYNLFYFNTDLIKMLLEEIKTDWQEVEDSSEIKILEEYAFESLVLTGVLFFLVIVSIIILVIMEFTPIVLDIVTPMDESRPRKLKIDYEMFLDEKQYFYVYLTFEIMSVTVSFVTLVATGTLMLACMKHCCATHKIARFCKIIMDVPNKWFFVIMALGVFSLSCNLLRLQLAALLMKEIPDIVVTLAVVTGHFVIMFISNLTGQSVIDHGTEVFYATYRTTWYLAPLPIQKLLLFIMQRNAKTYTLMVGGIFIANLEGFTTLVTTAVSYFTVIHNVN